jgi:hypothetical protein
MLSTDYLIIGSGALGMAFADQLLTETDADMVIVDRRHMPGGHWNDAYPFVRLHQPSAFYGVGSRALGSSRLDVAGFNKGYYELASGAQIVNYYDRLMNERFLPSGRVQYFPLCDYQGDNRFVSRLSGHIQEVTFRKKLVDATFLNTQVPSTHLPSFELGEGVRLVTPNMLPKFAPDFKSYVLLGGGKTAMDVGVWLLQMGAAPESIRWIVPRDSWLRNRDKVQPGEAFFKQTAGAQADLFEAAAEAICLGDLFDRLERTGQVFRIDTTVKPTMFRGATISRREVEALRCIKDVVRKGRVLRIEQEKVVLEHGTVENCSGSLYVDCTAKAFRTQPSVRVFDGDRITIQMLRPGALCFSAAVIGHIEAAYDDEAIKNELCKPMQTPDAPEDLARNALDDLRTGRRWSTEKNLHRWMAEHRLTGAGIGPADAAAHDPEAERIRARLREARPKAAANLSRLLAE